MQIFTLLAVFITSLLGIGLLIILLALSRFVPLGPGSTLSGLELDAHPV